MGVILHPVWFSVTYHPGTQNTKADALSRLHESSIIPPNQESIISPTVILAPIQWDIMTEIAEAQATDPPPAETPTQSHLRTTCSPSESDSMGTRYPQFRSSRYRRHRSVTHQPLLVVHIAGRYH